MSQVALAVYFQAVVWFPLGSLNDQRGAPNRPLVEQFSAGTATWGDAALAFTFMLPAALFVGGCLKRIPALMWLCLVSYTVWMALQIQTWWVAYIFGASERWQGVYHRVFGRTLKILPSFGNHLAPDAMHFIMQVLLVLGIISGVVGMLKRDRVTTTIAKGVVQSGGSGVE